MNLAKVPSEVWIDLQYKYRDESFQFNLPLTRGEKYLDGLRLDFTYIDIEGGRHLHLDIKPLGKVVLESLVITGNLRFQNTLKSVFVNGYQSASGSRERSLGERISALNWPGRLLGLHLPGDASFYPYSEKKGRFHGYSYGYLRFPDGLVFAGSLNESAGFTIIDFDVKKGLFAISKDVNGLHLDDSRKILDLVLLDGDEDKVFDQYLALRDESPRIGRRAIAWTTDRINRGVIDEVRVRKSLAEYREAALPLTYFIVDDGWQSHQGDWDQPAAGFPSGMASLATEIKGSGYIPGIRFAPFIVDLESSIFRNRKDWLARDRRRRVRPAGRLPGHGGPFFALDTSRDDVKDFIRSTVGRFRDEWGFGFIRADHLYAAGVYPPAGMSRGEAISDAMSFLSSVTGDCSIEYSGVPLESAFSKGEYCRVAADTTPNWENLYRRNIHSRERASTLNALRSTVGRRQLNGRFFASSLDTFRLSNEKTSMEASRKYTQILLHYLLGDLLSMSGELSDLDEESSSFLRTLFPLLDPEIMNVNEFRRTVTIRYNVGGREYISISNLAERPRSFSLPGGQWFGSPGLKRRAHHISGGSSQMLKPGQSRNYLLLSNEYNYVYAGSDGHFIPGAEISDISRVAGGWQVKPVEGVSREFTIWLRNDGGGPVLINGNEAENVETVFGVSLAFAPVFPDSIR